MYVIFFFNDTATTEIYTLSLHDALPIYLQCADDVRAVIETETTGHVAAFIAEPIQGVGGFIEAPPGYFERVKEILDETGILFISDEVQTAFGRTGSHFWGIEAFDAEPDMIKIG